MKKEVYILYSADAWITIDSLSVIAVCTNIDKVVKLAKRYAKANDKKLTKYEEECLLNNRHTQGREMNFYIEKWITDKLI